jgi:hypothetical protein
LEDENESPPKMAQNAGDEDNPYDLFIGLVGFVEDAKI